MVFSQLFCLRDQRDGKNGGPVSRCPAKHELQNSLEDKLGTAAGQPLLAHVAQGRATR